VNAARRATATILIVTAAVLSDPGELAGQPASQRQTVQAGPARLEVTIKGRGEPVVFIPSRGRGVEDFEDLSTRLVSVGYQAILPEPRGIGGSTGPLDGITYHDLASDVAAVIESTARGTVGERAAACRGVSQPRDGR
jgi:pimeloyl-ACP methyl ester carboxylesterase